MKKLILIILFILIIIPVGILTYYGVMPVFSTVLGFNKPVDLGIKYDRTHYENYVNKARTKIENFTSTETTKKSIIPTGQLPLKQSFNSEEISARLNYATWKYMPFTKTQVRINQDGTVEFSGLLIVNRINGFLEATGLSMIPKDQIKAAIKLVSLMGNIPLYASFQGKVDKNKSEVKLLSLKVANYQVPFEKYHGSELAKQATDIIMDQVAGFYAERAYFEDGKLFFEGTVPEKIMVEK